MGESRSTAPESVRREVQNSTKVGQTMYMCLEGYSTDEKSGSRSHTAPARSMEIGQKRVKAPLNVRRTAAPKGMRREEIIRTSSKCGGRLN